MAPALEYQLYESRDFALLFEGCTASTGNTASHTVRLGHSLVELIQSTDVGDETKKNKT